MLKKLNVSNKLQFQNQFVFNFFALQARRKLK